MHFLNIILTLLAQLLSTIAFPIDITPNQATATELFTRQPYTDIATTYTQNGAFGSCGAQNPDSALLVSVSASFGPNALCGHRIRVTNTGPTTDHSIGGKGNVVEVTVADTCVGCDEGHLDLSDGAWDILTDSGYSSQVGISW